MDSDSSSILFQFILIGVLTSINAFFAAAEMAIVSANKSKVRKLKEDGNKKAKLLERLMDEPSSFLSTIQVGITLAGFFSSASAATGIADDVARVLIGLHIPYTQNIAMIGVTLLLSYITLVFGELVPKRIALRGAESIALFATPMIYGVSVVAKPFIKILTFSTSLVLKLVGQSQVEEEERISEEEIRAFISQSQQDGCIEDEEQQMIEGVLDFNDKMAKEIMTPRKDTFMLDISIPITELIDDILENNYSRVPVYEDSIDHIIGVLYIKELLKEAKRVGFEHICLKSIIHTPFFVPETKKANELFTELKCKKNHMALLVDEYGGFAGIVTMEDLIEEILGDINDEYDVEEMEIEQISEDTYRVKGSVSIHRLNTQLHINIESGEYDTLNGYLLTQLDTIPNEKVQSEIQTGRANFKIIEVGNKRIEEVEITINEQVS